jgi:phage tail-like protein
MPPIQPHAAAGPPGLRRDPYRACHFAVEIEGLLVAGFTGVEGLEATIQTEDYFEGGRNDAPHKLIGTTTWHNLTLSRGFTDSEELWRWFEATLVGRIQRKRGAVVLLDPDRRVARTWLFRDAIPVRWVGPHFDASRDNEVAIERLELAHSGLSLAGFGGRR